MDMDLTQAVVLAAGCGCAIAACVILSKSKGALADGAANGAANGSANGAANGAGKKKKSKSKRKRSKNKREKAQKEAAKETVEAPVSKNSKANNPKANTKAAAAPAESKEEGGKLTRNQRRKRNQRARLAAEKEKEEKEKKKVEAKKAKNKKPGNAKNTSSLSEKEKAKQRYEDYQKDLDDGWETVGADKSAKVQARKKTSKKKAKAAEKKAEEVKTGPIKSQAKIEVDPRHYGKIIGTGGATLKSIMQKSGATINMPRKDAEVPSKIVVIEGTGEEIGLAKSAIHELITKGYSRLINPEIAEGAISVDPKLHGLIIGPGGSVINMLKQKTGVQINLPDSKSQSRRIQLSGTKNGIKTCKQQIKFLVNYKYSPLLNPKLRHVEVHVPSEKMGLVIGPKASTRRHIEGNTKAKIHCPHRDDENKNVVIVGTIDSCERAKKAILKIIQKSEEPSEPAEQPEHYEEEDDEDQPDEIAAQYLIDSSHQAAEEDNMWPNNEDVPADTGAQNQQSWAVDATEDPAKDHEAGNWEE